ncbi:MAG: N-acetylmuramoyl-L-alanine amidase, partial [Lentisphaeria bacterium]|nr:N-acetylmuramoyl-L-alanine amidase [Lentisphaeria bacterium]
LFAFLCWKFNLDPLADGVIISHHEGHLRGIASGHVDPEHLWTQLQMPLTMDKFRQDVNDHLNAYKAFRDSSWRMFKNRWWNNAIRGNDLGPME